MEIFNIGPLELLFILVIALVVLGPKEMVNTAKKISRMIAKIIRSPFWASIMDTTREIRDFPRKIMRETGLDENINELSRMRGPQLPDRYSIGDPLRTSKTGEVASPEKDVLNGEVSDNPVVENSSDQQAKDQSIDRVGTKSKNNDEPIENE